MKKRRWAAILMAVVFVLQVIVSGSGNEAFASLYGENVGGTIAAWNGRATRSSQPVYVNGAVTMHEPIFLDFTAEDGRWCAPYCLEKGVTLKTSKATTGSLDAYNKLNKDQKQQLKRLSGFMTFVVTTTDDNAANWYWTYQCLIWHYCGQMSDTDAQLTLTNGYGIWSEYQRIRGLMDSYESRVSYGASFPNLIGTNQTYRMTYDAASGTYQTIIHDTSGMLSGGYFNNATSSNPNVSFIQCNADGSANGSGEYLKITSTVPIDRAAPVVCSQTKKSEYTPYSPNDVVLYNGSGYQTAFFFGDKSNDPVYAYFQVYTDSELAVSKKEITGDAELPGASLILYNSAGQVVDSWVSGTTPHIIRGLASGGYTLHETTAPDRHVLASDIAFNYDAASGTTQQVVMRDDYTSVRLNKVNESGNPLSGATMKLVDASGQVVDTWISDGTEHEVKGLPFGTYSWIEESAPDGYQLADPITVTVDMNGSGRGTMTDKETYVELLKVDENNKPLAGATLEILDATGAIIDTWVTGKTQHTVTGLKYGNYTLHEAKAPSGYQLAKDVPFTVTDERKTVTVTMEDKETVTRFMKYGEDKEPLAGATLEILDATGAVIDTWVTDGSWHEVKNLSFGTYTLHEAKAPEGWTVAEDVSFEVTSDPRTVTVTMSDRRIYGNFRLHKTSLQIPGKELQGATFSLYRTFDDGTADECLGDYTTDEHGEIYIEHLVYGKYYLKEIEANEHYYLNPENCEFEIREDGETVSADYINTAIVGVLHVRYENKFRRGQFVAGTPMTGDLEHPELALAILFMMLAIGAKEIITHRKR